MFSTIFNSQSYFVYLFYFPIICWPFTLCWNTISIRQYDSRYCEWRLDDKGSAEQGDWRLLSILSKCRAHQTTSMFLAFLLSDAATNLDIHSVHLTYFKICYIMIIDDEQMRKTQQHSHTQSLPRDPFFAHIFVHASFPPQSVFIFLNMKWTLDLMRSKVRGRGSDWQLCFAFAKLRKCWRCKDKFKVNLVIFWSYPQKMDAVHVCFAHTKVCLFRWDGLIHVHVCCSFLWKCTEVGRMNPDWISTQKHILDR